jgi:hypothetical protein
LRAERFRGGEAWQDENFGDVGRVAGLVGRRGKKRETSLITFSSRKRKISGLLLSMFGVNFPVCQPFTTTMARCT